MKILTTYLLYINIDNELIKNVNDGKILGITFDKKLNRNKSTKL